MFSKKGCLTAMLLILLAGCSAAKENQNIVVIGWDGSQRDHVKEMLSQNELLNLSALSQEGRMVDIDITNGATDTKAGWAQIFTGYTAEITGVYNNGNYRPIPEGYTVFERAESHFGADNIDTVAVIGKKNHIGNASPRKVAYDRWLARIEKLQQAAPEKARKAARRPHEIVEEDGKKFVVFPGEPWQTASAKMDLFVNGLQTNEKVGTRALEELDKHKDRRLLMFIHFPDPDHPGHKHGENSQEYTDALKDDDRWTGRIIDKLKQIGIYEKTLVYVVVDHGFDEGQTSHRYAPYVFLAGNDQTVTRDGDRMDIAPTILKRLGIDVAKINPPLSGTPLDEPVERKIAPTENPNPKKKAMTGKKKPGGQRRKNPIQPKPDTTEQTPPEAIPERKN